MKRLVLIVLLCTVFLQGCAFLDFFRKKEDAAVPPPEKVVQVDPKSLQPCKPLPYLTQDILDNTAAIVLVYKDCVIKQDNSIILLKKFSNYKEPVQ